MLLSRAKDTVVFMWEQLNNADCVTRYNKKQIKTIEPY